VVKIEYYIYQQTTAFRVCVWSSVFGHYTCNNIKMEEILHTYLTWDHCNWMVNEGTH